MQLEKTKADQNRPQHEKDLKRKQDRACQAEKQHRVENNKTDENRTQQDSFIFTNFKQCLSNIY